MLTPHAASTLLMLPLPRPQVFASTLRGDSAVDVVVAQLRTLQLADLHRAHEFMSPPYQSGDDAFERFSLWFSSPLYEALCGCSEWRLRGSVTTREEARETPLADGGSFLGSVSVQQQVRVAVKAGRPKWVESGASGSRVGRLLPEITYLWTVSLQDDGCWKVDQIIPEASTFAPVMQSSRVTRQDVINANEDPDAVSSAAWPELLLAGIALLVAITVGQWLGEQTGVFGSSLDTAYFDDTPSKATLYNLLD